MFNWPNQIDFSFLLLKIDFISFLVWHCTCLNASDNMFQFNHTAFDLVYSFQRKRNGENECLMCNVQWSNNTWNHDNDFVTLLMRYTIQTFNNVFEKVLDFLSLFFFIIFINMDIVYVQYSIIRYQLLDAETRNWVCSMSTPELIAFEMYLFIIKWLLGLWRVTNNGSYTVFYGLIYTKLSFLLKTSKFYFIYQIFFHTQLNINQNLYNFDNSNCNWTNRYRNCLKP